ncbi:hypothetical protein WJX81_002799 [Elliptochloris bilobata]|uniref:Cytochrome P450 n=1 Tax=Elliptochloris bilobata TaxID=381761 RepID=A0AAW1RF53_9CHLO
MISFNATAGRHGTCWRRERALAHLPGPFFLLLTSAWNLWRRERALAHLPGPDHRGLFGGMDFINKKAVHREATKLVNQYGPLFKLRILAFHAVVITDPVLATAVLRSRDLDKMRFQYSFLDPFLGGANMLTGPTDEHWRAVRKAVAPAFSASSMREAFRQVRERSQQLVAILLEAGPGKAHNVDEMLLKESMDVIGAPDCAGLISAPNRAGGDPGAAQNVQALLSSTKEIEMRLAQIFRWWRLWHRDVRQGWLIISRFRAIVQTLLDHIQAAPPTPGSFADLLRRARDPRTGAALSSRQMFPEIAALFFAGIDTTGHTGTFVMYMISQHPAVAAKLAKELEAAGLLVTPARPCPRALEFADLAQLPYLQAVIKETLRLYPPVAVGQIRCNASKDVVLAGRLTLPRGTAVWVPHAALHMAAFNWPQPDAFLPERWLTEEGLLAPDIEYADPALLALPPEWYSPADLAAVAGGSGGSTDGVAASAAARPRRYMPFAEGPRNCVGQSLAKMSLAATIATLLQTFTFRLADEMGGPEGVRAQEHYSLVIGLSEGMLMHLDARPGVTCVAAAAAACG